jgi:hypothetical protein
MTKKARDFYHVQDRLALAWSYATFGQDPFSPKILSLSREIEEALDIIKPIPPMLAPFIELTRKKISLLEDALAKSRLVEGESSESQEASFDEVEVSLSSSGMGFFSQNFIDEDTKIIVTLKLDTLALNLRVDAIVLECKVSADSENPGYWVRVRFDRDQNSEIDQLLAHVTKRQIEKLHRKTNNSNTSEIEGAEC